MKIAAAAILLAACSDPDAYPGGGRFETLPGQTGGALVPADGGTSPREDGGALPDATAAG
jgi:hypothetical protein